jgi:hypothetical protein
MSSSKTIRRRPQVALGGATITKKWFIDIITERAGDFINDTECKYFDITYGFPLDERVNTTYTKWIEEWIEKFNTLNPTNKLRMIIEEDDYHIYRLKDDEINYPEVDDDDDEELFLTVEEIADGNRDTIELFDDLTEIQTEAINKIINTKRNKNRKELYEMLERFTCVTVEKINTADE